MSRQRIWIVNGALGLLLVWGGMRLRNEWSAFGATHQAGRLQSTLARTAVRTPGEGVSSTAPDTDWTDIASRSPFSFDRNDSNLDLTEAVAAPVAGPRPVLLGTLDLGNGRMALMGKPGSDGRSGSPVKVGQTFEGWQVVEIHDNAVVVTANGARESIAVARAPTMRSSEKTSSSATTPTANSISTPSAATPARPAATPSGNANTNALLGLGSRAPRPADMPPGTHVEETPFGPKIVQDSK